MKKKGAAIGDFDGQIRLLFRFSLRKTSIVSAHQASDYRSFLHEFRTILSSIAMIPWSFGGSSSKIPGKTERKWCMPLEQCLWMTSSTFSFLLQLQILAKLCGPYAFLWSIMTQRNLFFIIFLWNGRNFYLDFDCTACTFWTTCEFNVASIPVYLGIMDFKPSFPKNDGISLVHIRRIERVLNGFWWIPVSQQWLWSCHLISVPSTLKILAGYTSASCLRPFFFANSCPIKHSVAPESNKHFHTDNVLLCQPFWSQSGLSGTSTLPVLINFFFLDAFPSSVSFEITVLSALGPMCVNMGSQLLAWSTAPSSTSSTEIDFFGWYRGIYCPSIAKPDCPLSSNSPFH